MSLARKIFLLLLTVLPSFVCDQASKHLAASYLKGQPVAAVLAGSLRLEYAENTGAFLGLGSALGDTERWLVLAGLTAASLGALVLFICLQSVLPTLASCGLNAIVAGGLCNVHDRLTAGKVVDFVSIGIGPWRSGIFNLADAVLLSGLLCVLVSHWLGHRTAKALASASA